MSEYIVDLGDDGKSAVRIAMAKQHGAMVRGEIVRCRDCIYYTEDPEPIDPGWPMMCERTGADMVEPYGFCAWPERKEGGDD